MDFPEGLIQVLREAQHIVILTGAGISAESGIPTFRDAQTGLWAQYNPEELATPKAFKSNPVLVWQWYQWRRKIIRQAKPNPGHAALAEIEVHTTNQGFEFTLITQNVDGLHRKAGNRQIIELHGNIHRNKCFDCGITADDEIKDSPEPPHCRHCNGLLRPGVVWFGENLSAPVMHAAWEAVETCDVFLSIGTSALVQPAASLPMIAMQNGATLVEVNPDITSISALATYVLKGPSGEILPALVQAVWQTQIGDRDV